MLNKDYVQISLVASENKTDVKQNNTQSRTKKTCKIY